MFKRKVLRNIFYLFGLLNFFHLLNSPSRKNDLTFGISSRVFLRIQSESVSGWNNVRI